MASRIKAFVYEPKRSDLTVAFWVHSGDSQLAAKLTRSARAVAKQAGVALSPDKATVVPKEKYGKAMIRVRFAASDAARVKEAYSLAYEALSGYGIAVDVGPAAERVHKGTQGKKANPKRSKPKARKAPAKRRVRRAKK